MKTAFFWITWGIISFWALKTFYYSFSKEKLEHLRKAALEINLAVLILTFLPWLPPSLGDKSGLALALERNVLVLIFIILITFSILLFLFKDSLLLKLASGATITNSIFLFIIMSQLRPGTFLLTWHDLAPIAAILLLLMGDVVALLLLQQLELQSITSQSLKDSKQTFHLSKKVLKG